MIVIDVERLYRGGTAKLEAVDGYVKEAVQTAGNGNDVTLTGRGPVWLYLMVAHALHGKARKLVYNSPVTGDIVVFDHNPF